MRLSKRVSRLLTGGLSFTLISSAALATGPGFTNNEVRSYGKGLAYWMDVRENCGTGASFAGVAHNVRSKVAAFHAAADSLGGYSAASFTGLSSTFVASGNSMRGLMTGDNVIRQDSDAQAAVRALGAMSAELSRLIQANPQQAGPYRVVQGRVTRALAAARGASYAAACAHAEAEIRFIVYKTVRAVPPEDESPIDLPNTLGETPLVVRGQTCATLEEVATNIAGVIQDTNEALIHGRAYYQRAVAAQMVVEYLRKHGGREGRLDARRDARLRAMTSSLVSRMVDEEGRLPSQ